MTSEARALVRVLSRAEGPALDFGAGAPFKVARVGHGTRLRSGVPTAWVLYDRAGREVCRSVFPVREVLRAQEEARVVRVLPVTPAEVVVESP